MILSSSELEYKGENGRTGGDTVAEAGHEAEATIDDRSLSPSGRLTAPFL